MGAAKIGFASVGTGSTARLGAGADSMSLGAGKGASTAGVSIAGDDGSATATGSEGVGSGARASASIAVMAGGPVSSLVNSIETALSGEQLARGSPEREHEQNDQAAESNRSGQIEPSAAVRSARQTDQAVNRRDDRT